MIHTRGEKKEKNQEKGIYNKGDIDGADGGWWMVEEGEYEERESRKGNEEIREREKKRERAKERNMVCCLCLFVSSSPIGYWLLVVDANLSLFSLWTSGDKGGRMRKDI